MLGHNVGWVWAWNSVMERYLKTAPCGTTQLLGTGLLELLDTSNYFYINQNG